MISPLPGPTVPTPHPALGGPQDSIQQGGRLDGQRPPTAAVSPPPPIMTLLWDPRAEEGDGFLLTCHPPLVRRPGPGPRTPRVLTHSPPDSGDTSYPQPPSGKETPVFLVGTSGLEAASLPRISQVGAEGPHGARLALQPLPLTDSATKRTSHTWQGAGTLSSLGSLGLAGGRGQWDYVGTKSGVPSRLGPALAHPWLDGATWWTFPRLHSSGPGIPVKGVSCPDPSRAL